MEGEDLVDEGVETLVEKSGRGCEIEDGLERWEEWDHVGRGSRRPRIPK